MASKVDLGPQRSISEQETLPRVARRDQQADASGDAVASAQTVLADGGSGKRLALHDSEAFRDTAVDRTTPGLWGKGDSSPGEVDTEPFALEGERYVKRRTLGEGGMGEVVLATDVWLGRDVAKKTIRGGDAEGTMGRRFLREARIQGQLEHPNIVPVYDLGRDEQGAPTFTMKRVQGVTLRHALEKLRQGSAEVEEELSQRKLLAVLSQTAMALAYAHARGVVHRDLKPENIMLGEFGEVYVLDWGVAKTAHTEDEPPTSKNAPSLPPPDAELQTAAGVLVGTPGYMSPEQARGEALLATPASDVYALGLILFEILAGDPAHQGTSLHALLATTLQRDGLRPAERAPEGGVPPELDELCFDATRVDPAERLGSMREFARRLDKFLDGERDTERRRQLAEEHLTRAEALLMRSAEGEAGERDRSEGLRELGRALALEPSERALGLLTRSILSGSDELPREAEQELVAVGLADRRQAARRTLVTYGFWIFVVAGTFWMGFRDWVAAAFIDVVLVTTVLYTAWMVKTKRTGPRYMRVALGLNFLLVGGFASFVGPLFVVPAVAIMMGATMIVSLRANRPTRALVTGGAMATVLVPLALEWTGVLPPSYVFEDGVIKVLPRIADFPPTATLLALIGSALAPILLTGLLVGRSTDALLKAERKNFAQAYRLKQLLPPGAAEEPPKSSEAAPWCESLGGVRRAARVGKRST